MQHKINIILICVIFKHRMKQYLYNKLEYGKIVKNILFNLQLNLKKSDSNKFSYWTFIKLN